MSYGVAAALQTAVFGALAGDAALSAAVGGAIFDAAPSGAAPPLYVMLGAEDVRERNDGFGRGARHDFVVSVVTDVAGFHSAKAAAVLVSDILQDAGLTLTRGRLVSLEFLRARARRTAQGTRRQIDLRFRARVEDD